MLFNLFLFALLASEALSTSRYFVGLFYKSYPWAFPLDLCVTPDLGATYVKYTCSVDGNTLTATNYTDSKCTTSSVSKTYTSSSSINGLYAFNCDGTDDYTQIKLSVGGCGSSALLTGTVYSAINTCFEIGQYSNVSVLDYYEQTQCNSSTAIISTYLSGIESCDASSNYAKLVSQSAVTTACNFFIKVTLPGTKITESVDAQMLDCRYSNITQLPVVESNSASYPNSKAVATYNLSIDIGASADATSDPGLCTYNWYSYFTNRFSGSLVMVTTTCDSDEGVGYPGIYVDVYSEVYSTSSESNCDTLTSAIGTWIENTFTSVTVESISCAMVTAPSSTSSGNMNVFNYFIALIMFCFAIISM